MEKNSLDIIKQKRLDFYNFMCSIFHSLSRHYMNKSIRLLQNHRLEGEFAKEYYKFLNRNS